MSTRVPASIDQPAIDFVHTGPGTLAGRYLRSFWQPVCPAEELLPGRALPLRIMSEDYTLYRGESGTPHLVDSRCAHRGTQLSVGWVEGDHIRCFYHGWKYDGAGQCVERPAEQESGSAAIRIPSFPVREYLGLIYAYFGQGEPPPFPRYAHLESADGFIEMDGFFRRCNYFQNLENTVDPAHLNFVHGNVDHSYGDGDHPIVTALESGWGVTAYADRPSGRRTVTQFGMPNAYLHKPLPNMAGTYLVREFLSYYVPVDDQSHHQFTVSKVSLTGDAAERYKEQRARIKAQRDLPHQQLADDILAGKLRWQDVDPARTDIVRLQDDLAQVGQGRLWDRTRERLGRSDVAVVMIRRLWSRELNALAEGKPLKNWRYGAELQVQRDIPLPVA